MGTTLAEMTPIRVRVADGRTIMGGDNPVLLIDGEMSVVGVVEKPTGITFQVMVKRAGDDDGRIAEAKPEVFESAQLWNAWLTRTAGINGRINNKNRQVLKDWLFNQAYIATPSLQVSRVGHLHDHDIIVFSNGIIDARGVVNPRSANLVRSTEVVVRGGGRRAFIVDPGDFGTDIPELPVVVPDALMDGGKPEERASVVSNARAVLARLMDVADANYGNSAVAFGLGYLMCHAVSGAVFAREHRFPHLYIHGPTGTGKDVLARVLYQVACGNEHGAIKAGTSTTPKMVRNAMGRNSLLPLWINELRNAKEDAWLNPFIRTAYDRQGSAVATIDQGRMDFPVVRSMMLVGESVVGGDAEYSRYVELQTRRVDNPKGFSAVVDLLHDARVAWMALLTEFHRFASVACRRIHAVRDKLVYAGLDDRRAFGWACAVVGLAWIIDPDVEDASDVMSHRRWQEVLHRANASLERSVDTGAFHLFWEAASSARTAGHLANDAQDPYTWTQDSHLYVAMQTLYARIQAGTRADVPDRTLVSNEISRAGCLLRKGKVKMRSGYTRSVHVFDMNHAEFREYFPRWFVSIAEEGGRHAGFDREDKP